MLSLYNTLTKRKETFTPLNPGKVTLYTCGPTVYDYVHIGNLRAYTTADVLRRYLTFSGYEVRAIQNITDVGHLTQDDVAQGDAGEDKMLKKARLEHKDPHEIARFYENAAKEAEADVNILPANYMPRATEHIPQMIAMIQTLLDHGYAYVSNGNVFFDVTKADGYGKLSGNTLEQLNVGARLEEPHPDKRNQWDFALWLKAGPEHLMRWKSPWSVGYPGWHIECSAMSTEYLGTTIDIHTGGEDNIFPHHEAEIAQSECANKQPFVHYWIHTRHLLVDGKKMSKSLGNFYTLPDIVEHGFTPADLRMLYLMSHYRSQMNFTWDALAQAAKNRAALIRFWTRLHDTPGNASGETLDITSFATAFAEAMDDDLNTPRALAALLAIVTAGNTALDRGALANAKELITFFARAVEDVLGIVFTQDTPDAPADVAALAKKRAAARIAKDFATADQLRDDIAARGYTVEDTAEGFSLQKN